MSFKRPEEPETVEVDGVQFRPSSLGKNEVDKRLPIAPNWPFFLLHWWENWELETEGLEAPTWLPQLHPQFIRPGVDMVRAKRKETDDDKTMYDDALDLLRRKEGMTILPHTVEVEVDGQVLRDYAVEADCRDPISKRIGTFHCERWMSPKRKQEGKRLKFRFDRGLYNRWRLELVRMGVIAPPDEDIVKAKIDRAVYHRDRHATETKHSPEQRDAQVREREAAIEQIEAARVPDIDEDLKPRRDRKPKPATAPKAPAAGKGGEQPSDKGAGAKAGKGVVKADAPKDAAKGATEPAAPAPKEGA